MATTESNRVETKLQDGELVVINCSNCDKPLVKIHITRPNEKRKNGSPVECKVKADCCYCGDESFIKTIKGGFHYSGWDVPHPNGNVEDVDVYVNVTYPDIQKDILIFRTEKVK
jgi:hypothetical protein